MVTPLGGPQTWAPATGTGSVDAALGMAPAIADAGWSDLTWSGLTWSGLTWSGLTWSGDVWT